MRIAYVSTDLGVPVYGRKGASIHVRELTHALQRLGHEVLLLTARAGGDPPAGFDVPVCELAPSSQETALQELLAADPAAGPAVAADMRAALIAASFRPRASAVLHEFEPDLIYERYALFGTAGVALARERRLPLVLEVNAPMSEEQAAHRRLAFVETARAVERSVLASADRLVAVSHALGGWLVGMGVEPGRIVVLPNAADPARFEAAESERDAVRAGLGLAEASVVGFLGSLRPWHDTTTLVQATALLRRRGRPAHLLVLGDGPGRERLEHLVRREGVAEATTFAGAVPHERVPAYLAAVDVAVIPYPRTDSFYFSPLKLFECLASGNPVVAADVGEIGEVVQHGETGLLYPPGDAAGLAGAIESLLDDPGRAASLGASGRAEVRMRHTWEANARVVAGLAEASLAATPVGVHA